MPTRGPTSKELKDKAAVAKVTRHTEIVDKAIALKKSA